MLLAEYSLSMCPKCNSLGAFIAVFLSDTTDCTRDSIMRVVVNHDSCGFSLMREDRISFRKLDKLGMYDKYKVGEEDVE